MQLTMTEMINYSMFSMSSASLTMPATHLPTLMGSVTLPVSAELREVLPLEHAPEVSESVITSQGPAEDLLRKTIHSSPAPRQTQAPACLVSVRPVRIFTK